LEDFIFTVPSRRLQDRLDQAIRGQGAFRRFKDVLAGCPDEHKRWFVFKSGTRNTAGTRQTTCAPTTKIGRSAPMSILLPSKPRYLTCQYNQ
jgi:hypothetical protein